MERWNQGHQTSLGVLVQAAPKLGVSARLCISFSETHCVFMCVWSVEVRGQTAQAVTCLLSLCALQGSNTVVSECLCHWASSPAQSSLEKGLVEKGQRGMALPASQRHPHFTTRTCEALSVATGALDEGMAVGGAIVWLVSFSFLQLSLLDYYYYYIYLFTCDVGGSTCTPWCVCGGQRAEASLLTRWMPDIKFRWSDMAPSPTEPPPRPRDAIVSLIKLLSSRRCLGPVVGVVN